MKRHWLLVRFDVQFRCFFQSLVEVACTSAAIRKFIMHETTRDAARKQETAMQALVPYKASVNLLRESEMGICHEATLFFHTV